MAGSEAETHSKVEHVSRAMYELGYHIVGTAREQELPKFVSELKSEIEQRGGLFVMEEFPTPLSLAYTMTKARHGAKEWYDSVYFGWVKFEFSPDQLKDLKAVLDGHEHVLRYLLMKTVREDTRAPRRVMMPKTDTSAPTSPKRPPPAPMVRREEKSAPVSDEELDRTIEELVVE